VNYRIRLKVLEPVAIELQFVVAEGGAGLDEIVGGGARVVEKAR
jgi:hypothetical protein